MVHIKARHYSSLLDVCLDVVPNDALEVRVHGEPQVSRSVARDNRADVDLLDARGTGVGSHLSDAPEWNTLLLGDLLACFPDHAQREACARHLNNAIVTELGAIDLDSDSRAGCNGVEEE